MLEVKELPIVHPTDTEVSIWRCAGLRKTGGLVRTGAHVFKDCVDWEGFYGEPDKLNPEDWEAKMLAGFRGEWFAHILEGCERVLDVGCGFGFPSFYLSRYGHRVVGVDASLSEIDMAKKIAARMKPSPEVDFQVVGQKALPFAEGSFEGASLCTSLECVEDPATLLGELKRVLRGGSSVAIEEEDRSLEPQTHPVWEKLRWAFFENATWLWYETRVRKPYCDRRYMLLLDPEGEVASRLRSRALSVQGRRDGLPIVDFAEPGIPLDQALSEVTDGHWSEAEGFDPWTLKQLLEKKDFRDIRFWLLPDGEKLAHCLEENQLLRRMPGDVRGILRSILGSMQSTDIPVSCVVSCRTP